MSWDGTFKYNAIDPSRVNQVLTKYKGQEILDYVIELYRLIDYQKDLISQYEKKIIAFKHHEAWKHYDKPIEKYNPETRKYES